MQISKKSLSSSSPTYNSQTKNRDDQWRNAPCAAKTLKVNRLSNSCLRFSKTVRLLGVNLDPYLNLESHVNNLVSECFYHLKNIAKIRRYLTDNEAQKLVHSFVSSKLDYTNSILYGMNASCLNKLQRVQNYAARLVCGFPSRLLATSSLLKNLHWLTIKQRIFFKLLLLVHKFFIGLAPQYFCEILLVKCDTERL